MNIVDIIKSNTRQQIKKQLENGLIHVKTILNGKLINTYYTDKFNKKQGLFKCFGLDGNLIFIEHYKNNKLHGEYILWSSNIIEWLLYEDGKIIEDKFRYYNGGIKWKQISNELREKYLKQ